MKRIALWILICASPITQVPAVPAPEPATEPSTVDAEATSDVTDGYQAMETLTRSLEIIRQNYVDRPAGRDGTPAPPLDRRSTAG